MKKELLSKMSKISQVEAAKVEKVELAIGDELRSMSSLKAKANDV